jgi:fructose-specific phosphotransferase system IIC component
MKINSFSNLFFVTGLLKQQQKNLMTATAAACSMAPVKD